MCIRTTNPTGTNLFEALQLQPKNKPVTEPVKESPVQQPSTKDSRVVSTEKEGKVAGAGIDFVDKQTEEYHVIPLRVTADSKLSFTEGEPGKFAVDENGNPRVDESGVFLIDEAEGKPVYVKANDKGEPIFNDKGEAEFVQPPKGKVEEVSQAEATTKVESQEGKVEEFDLAPILKDGVDDNLPEEQRIGKFKVDEKGVPLLDQEGKLIPDEKGEPVFVKVKKGQTDENGGLIPILDDKGEMSYISQKQVLDAETPPEIKKVMGAMESHSAQRLLTGLGYKSMAEGAVNLTSKTLIKGVSVGIPFTKKAIGFGAEHAVAKAISKELGKVSKATVKSGSTTILAATKTATEMATKNTVEALTQKGLLGKGVETLSMKEATKVAGSRVKAVSGAYKELKADLAALKAGDKALAEGLPKITKTAVEGIVKKESSLAIKFLKKDPYATSKAFGELAKNTYSKVVTQSIEKIAAEKGIKNVDALIKMANKKLPNEIIEGIVEISFKHGVELGSSKVLSKSALEKATSQIGNMAAKEATKVAEKVTSEAIISAGKVATAKTMLGVSEKIMVGAGEKALRDGTTKAIENGVAKAVKRSGTELAEKVTSKATADLLAKTAEKTAAKSVKTGSVIAGKTIAKYGSAVGHVANGAILAYDSVDAYKKISDPNVSTTSKALAGGTVVLDVASMVLQKKYAGLSYVATGLGIATSIGSDVTKDKK